MESILLRYLFLLPIVSRISATLYPSFLRAVEQDLLPVLGYPAQITFIFTDFLSVRKMRLVIKKPYE